MSTVTPPPPPHVPTPPVGGALNTTALVLGAPAQTLQALQALQAGQSLQAVMTAMPAANQIQVQTTLGLITLQTAMSLPRGAVLTLAMNPSTAQAPGPQGMGAQGVGAQPAPAALSFHITAINGKPVAGGQATSQIPGQASNPAPAGATQPGATQPLTPGQSVTATLVRPALGVPQAAPGAAPSTGNAASAATPAATPATLAGAKPGATAAASSSPASTTQAAQQTAQASTQTTIGQSTAQATTLATGTRFNATVQRVEAPGSAVTTPATPTPSTTAAAGKALASGQVLSGVVTGRTVGGQAIVQTPAATFALGATGGPGALGEGAKVTFRLDSAPLPPAASATAAAALRAPGAAHDLIAAKTWDDLSEALKTLVGSDPARLVQVAQTALPQPGAKLSSQMLFFLSALKGGDLKGLFGDTTLRLIDKERPGLLGRLGSDFQTMARLADEPQSGDWRLALVPLWTGEKLEQLRFFWRGGGGEEGGESEEETRFVLDVELSQLGRLQIDGLVKAKRHHLDLIIRSDQPLPAEMRADIAEIFDTAQSTLGLGGQVAFQAAPGNFVAIPEAPPGVGDGVIANHQSNGLLA